MYLIDKTLVDYIDAVDSDLPAPGGGSVAALVGALGVSLAKMSAHFSVTKKKFKEADKRKQDKFVLAFKELDYYKDLLIKGVDDDAISYETVTQAFKTKDQESIQKALKVSTIVAFDMQESSYKALKFVEKLIELGNKYLYSDLISAAILIAACNEMASLNVKANASMLDNQEEKEKYLSESLDMVNKSKRLKNKIINTINKV